MGTIRIDAVWFQSYSDDHMPAHVHGFTGEVQVIIDLFDDGTVALSERKNNIIPPNAKRSDVRNIVKAAIRNASRLQALWKEYHG